MRAHAVWGEGEGGDNFMTGAAFNMNGGGGGAALQCCREITFILNRLYRDISRYELLIAI